MSEDRKGCIHWVDSEGYVRSGVVLRRFDTAGDVDIDGQVTELMAEDLPVLLVQSADSGGWLVPSSWVVEIVQ